ncbi:MAG: Spo0E family sporulation regulatory protein-aspartic acid phosphatase [Clostridiaceae bacterium]
MEELRDELIRLIECKDIQSEEVIKTSEKLDELIVEYYNMKIKIPHTQIYLNC